MLVLLVARRGTRHLGHSSFASYQFWKGLADLVSGRPPASPCTARMAAAPAMAGGHEDRRPRHAQLRSGPGAEF